MKLFTTFSRVLLFASSTSARNIPRSNTTLSQETSRGFKVAAASAIDLSTIQPSPSLPTVTVTLVSASQFPTITPSPTMHLYCTNTSPEDGDGICTCNVGVHTTTITPPGGPGNACPRSISVPESAQIMNAQILATSTRSSPPGVTDAPTLSCSNNGLENSDGLCTCIAAGVTATLTPVGGRGAPCPKTMS
ncbi:hypothetical protein HYFRA_00006632 [Hymenoscyphus fraxineus]|uniref:Uncharacterized protein n=1 Tax=Hymenoscyphus fraxineus TaxID=746836 RepID=A0A9N9KYC9_9HELO|nr:hypothetical protein HYFRA_00006632 [Hymenoscyphus fraxineus]